MSRRSQVTRDGVVIGEHDQQTLLALLNAGTLRLTDTYWHRGMKGPVSLADLLCAGSRRTLLAHIQPWMVAVPFALLVSALWLHGSSSSSSVTSDLAEAAILPPSHSLPNIEIRRAVPVIVGGLSFDVTPDRVVDSPFAAARRLAVHSRATVLALDPQKRPLAIGSGMVIGDGTRLVASLRTVSGATTVEVHMANGVIQHPVEAVIGVPASIIIFTLPTAGIPIDCSTVGLRNGAPVCVAGHSLSSGREPLVAQVDELLAGASSGRYRLNQSLPPGSHGSAVLSAAGDLVGVVIDADAGEVLPACDVMSLHQSGIPGSLNALAAVPHIARPPALDVAETSISNGAVVVALRNRTDHVLRHALLHIACYELPPEAEEVLLLQERLRSAAVQFSLAPDNAADEALVAHQSLREVTERLENAHARLHLALPTAQRRVLRHHLLVVECELQPGLPQSIAHEMEAASNWGAVATVLDAGS